MVGRWISRDEDARWETSDVREVEDAEALAAAFCFAAERRSRVGEVGTGNTAI